MKIKWLGHSSFRLEESTGTAIVTDPYGSEVGFDLPKVSANAVTVSHYHNDHNAVEKVSGEPIVIDNVGAFEVEGIHVSSIRSFHDHHNGKRRGENLIFKFRIDGVDVCHMGDIGEECNARLCESIGSVNLLLLPVGGKYTVDAEQAKEYVDMLMPDIVIPMHYKTRDCSYELDGVSEFTDLFEDEDLVYIQGNSIEFDRTAFDRESTKVYILEK